MTSEQADRITLGWSHERLARVSGVATASVYLLERMGNIGSEDDMRVRNALDQGLAQRQIDFGNRHDPAGATPLTENDTS